MAKVSQINRNAKRERMAARDKTKRAALKSVLMDRDAAVEERFRRFDEAGAIAAEWRGRAGEVALPANGPGKGKLSQVQAMPYRAA